ncbi:MAG TPA: hypothetical protein VIZ19_05720, partial [Roseiarcus sp.]
ALYFPKAETCVIRLLTGGIGPTVVRRAEIKANDRNFAFFYLPLLEKIAGQAERTRCLRRAKTSRGAGQFRDPEARIVIAFSRLPVYEAH